MVAVEDEGYVRKVAAHVDGQIREVLGSGRLSIADGAVLAAMNIADQYYRELNYWQNSADTAYNRYQQAEQQAYDRQQDEYAKQQDAYDRLADMIVNMGYIPDADDLAAAGMSDSHYQAYLNYYNSLNAASGGGGGGSRKKKETSAYESVLAEQKAKIDKGKSVEQANSDVFNGRNIYGLTQEETQKMLVELTNYAVSTGKL